MKCFATGLSALLLLGGSLGQPTDLGVIDRYVEQEMRLLQIPGLAYAIVEDGKVVHIQAFGIAGPNRRAMTARTVLNTASVGKIFTALAVRQLAHAGKVDIGSPVQKYLPWFTLADKKAAARITVEQLLSHTSGLSNADGNHPALFRQGQSGEELVRFAARFGVNRQVGEGYEYSNLNYLILGEVIRAASGQSYEGYVQKNIFDRLGMTGSFFSADAARAAGFDVADGYRLLFGFPVVADSRVPLGAMASGQHFVTVEDMARFLAALSDHGRYGGRSLVTGEAGGFEANYSTDWEPQLNPDPYYGNGFSGGWITYSSGIEYLPNQRFGVVVLTNGNSWQAFNTKHPFDVAFEVMRLYHGWPLPPSKPRPGPYYLFADTILVLLGVGVVFHALRLRGWRERVRRSRRGRLAYLPWLLADLALPLAVLALFPAYATGLPTPWEGWERFVFSVPDIGYSLLAFCFATLAIGMVKLVLIAAPMPSASEGRRNAR
jgi:CubicO group peptidase (beta-lactamase class C family)